MLRHNVQFHWKNIAPTLVASLTALPPEGAGLAWGGPALRSAPTLGAAPDLERPFSSFEGFLMSLSQDKRKKIRQERRKVADAGVTFRWSLGKNITSKDWEFFYSCYERTYYEHGNAPYLSRDFFHRMAATMPENWLLSPAVDAWSEGKELIFGFALVAIIALSFAAAVRMTRQPVMT